MHHIFVYNIEIKSYIIINININIDTIKLNIISNLHISLIILYYMYENMQTTLVWKYLNAILLIKYYQTQIFIYF